MHGALGLLAGRHLTDHLLAAQLAFAAGTTDTGSNTDFTAYGPVIIATAGLITALVAALGRRDKKATDFTSNLDAKTKTALAGIQAYADRAEAERARCEVEKEQETARADAAEERERALLAEVAQLRAQLAQRSPTRNRPQVRSQPDG